MTNRRAATACKSLALLDVEPVQIGFEVHAGEYHHTVIGDATPFGEFTDRCKRGLLGRVDIQEVRKRRLRRYVDEHYAGNVSAFAQATGRQPSFFNDLFSRTRRKAFGEKLARALEKELGLPAYFLDALDDQNRDAPAPVVAPPRVPAEADLDRAWKAFPRELKAKLVSLVETVRQSLPAESNYPQDQATSGARLRRRRIEARRARRGKEDAG